MGGRPKPAFQEVVKAFADRGCKLLETEYHNRNTPMRYIATCGHEHKISYENFKRGKGNLCRACRYKHIGEAQQLGYEQIKAAFEAEGCVVLNDDFRTNRDPVRYIARCGHENVTDYNHFFDQNVGRVCSVCSKAIRYTYKYVRDYFEQQGCKLLSTEYVNCKTPLRFLARCGHETLLDFDHFANSKTYSMLCPACFSAKVLSGEIESRRHSVEMQTWRAAVYARDDYTCALCGRRGGRLQAHHLNGFAQFPEQGYELDNGVTLCVDCHHALHGFYGPKTTREQFQEFQEILSNLAR